jgi:hypothetical protein
MARGQRERPRPFAPHVLLVRPVKPGEHARVRAMQHDEKVSDDGT